MLEGTYFENFPRLVPTPAVLDRVRTENLSGGTPFGRVMEVRNSRGETITTPGVAVLERDEELYDPALDQAFPGLVYWIVTDEQILECDDSTASNLRLGGVTGVVALGEAGSIPLGHAAPGRGRFCTTTEPLERLIALDAVENPGQCRETLELVQLELRVMLDVHRQDPSGS